MFHFQLLPQIYNSLIAIDRHYQAYIKCRNLYLISGILFYYGGGDV